jgi:L-lactate dehydrogenase complex protein LldG
MVKRKMTKTSSINQRGSRDGSRESILASIRASLTTSAPFDADHQKHHQSDLVKIIPAIRPNLSRAALIDDFRTNLEFVGGYCTTVSNETEALKTIRSIIVRSGAKRVAVSDSPLVRSISSGINGAEIVENAPVEYLFASDIGITGAQWAIAETGTLVLVSDAERHRLTSLVPPVHVCLLKADTIRQTLGEILELTSAKLSPAVTFITGASRTSDIELTLAIGVHGPGELHVIVIAD